MIFFWILFVSHNFSIATDVPPTREQKGCVLATSILSISQVEKDDIESMFIPAQQGKLKDAIEASISGIFIKLQKARIPVHTRGDARDQICKNNPQESSLVATVKEKPTLVLCAPAQPTSAVVDAFRAEALGALQFNGSNDKAEELLRELLELKGVDKPVVVDVAKSYRMPLAAAHLLRTAIEQQKQKTDKLQLLDGPAYASKNVFQPSAWWDSPYRTLSSIGTFSMRASEEIVWAPSYEVFGGRQKFENQLEQQLRTVRCNTTADSAARHVLCSFKEYQSKNCVTQVLPACLEKYADEAVSEIESRRKYSSQNAETIKNILTVPPALACSSLLEFCSSMQKVALQSISRYLRLLRAEKARLPRECLAEGFEPSLGKARSEAANEALLEPLSKIINAYDTEGWGAFQSAVIVAARAQDLETVYGSYFSALLGYQGLTSKACAAPQSEPVCRSVLGR